MRRGGLAALALALALGADVHANELSTDVTVDLAGTLATDEDVVADAGAGAPARVDLGAIPAPADVTGYTVAPGGDVLFALDVTTALPGGVTATPQDVVRWNGAAYSIELRGADHGVPAGARIDAVGVVEGDLLLSFDVTVALGNVTADDEDLVRLEGTQPTVWSLFFDGSAAGVPAGADLDGADVVDQSGRLALSFDVSGTVGGVAFADEDVLEYAPGAGTWSKRFPGASRFPVLAAADVDALFVPEPAAAGAAALAALALLGRRRRRRASARVALAAALAAGLGAPAARAVDGVLEINQACALAGCFAGDAAGFPVTTQPDQAYALTGSLTVPDVNTTAIQLANGASLDLRGFAIRGPVTCGEATPASCTGTGTGVGVFVGAYASVRNGAIRGMGSHGVSGAGGLEAERVLVESNGGDGIRFATTGISGRGVIRDCRIFQNGGIGIHFNFGNPSGSLVEGNVIHGNTSDGLRGNGALIRGNRFSSNGGFGINVSFGGEGTGYGDNVFLNNNGGNANPQNSGGVQIGTNLCGGDTTCP